MQQRDRKTFHQPRNCSSIFLTPKLTENVPQQLQVRNPNGLRLTLGRSCLLTKAVMWILSLQCPIQLLTDGYLFKVSTSIIDVLAWARVRSEMGSQPGGSAALTLPGLSLCSVQGLWVNGTSFFNFLPFSPSHRSHFRPEWALLPFADLTFQELTWAAPKPGCMHGLLGAWHPQALSLSGEMFLKVLYHCLDFIQEALALPLSQIKT